ncbi:hypothetical protein OC842_007485 [Tilletia horrida]|uniref:Uncharacterized protein n=1 Tax=Tilletia horrida TaxID=155126 RepID=A0AAN6G3L5_9BASI|nr:hypothetical protein OC842_007485 [Tilletia horrida]
MAVPRLAAQFVGDDPGRATPSQVQRPQTPPPREDEDTELATEMAKLTPSTKSRVRSLIKGKTKQVVSPGTQSKKDRDADEAELAFYGYGGSGDSDGGEEVANPYQGKLDVSRSQEEGSHHRLPSHKGLSATAGSSSNKRQQLSPQGLPTAKKSRYGSASQDPAMQPGSQQRHVDSLQGIEQQQWQPEATTMATGASTAEATDAAAAAAAAAADAVVAA